MTGDLDALAPRLRDWLSGQLSGAEDLRLSGMFEPAQGYSSRTLVFTAHWNEGGTEHEKGFVARLQRTVSCPLLADIFHQQRVMSVASAVPGVPVPVPIAVEPDADVLGDPFFLMERAEGQVPPRFPELFAGLGGRLGPARPKTPVVERDGSDGTSSPHRLASIR